MKKGEIYEGIIEKVDFPNKGYVNIDGEKVIVKNGIPGQKVRFMINKKRSGRAEGRLLEILENSTLEVREPVCKIFPACGGCMYQTMSYEEQLKMKETQVKGLLQEAVGIGTDLHWEGIHGSPIEFGYRNKMEFSFGDEYKDGPLSLGLHKKGSTYDVLTASDCKLVHPDMTAILSSVLDFFTELGAVHYKKMQHTGYLRHLLLRRGVTSGEILVHVSTTMRRWYQGFWLFRWREKSWELCTLSMILCLMWCRAMKPDYFMDRITSMKRCWVCGLRLVHFPSSSQTHWQPKYCTPLCVITLVTPRIKKYLTSTAVLELLPSFLLLLRKRLSAWKLLRKLWKLQK